MSTYKFNRKQEKELDKRFIDREELTEKIIEKIGNIWGQELVDKKGRNIKEINEFANEILELLKNEG